MGITQQTVYECEICGTSKTITAGDIMQVQNWDYVTIRWTDTQFIKGSGKIFACGSCLRFLETDSIIDMAKNAAIGAKK